LPHSLVYMGGDIFALKELSQPIAVGHPGELLAELGVCIFLWPKLPIAASPVYECMALSLSLHFHELNAIGHSRSWCICLSKLHCSVFIASWASLCLASSLSGFACSNTAAIPNLHQSVLQIESSCVVGSC
jgi:hypothetical protein